MKCGKKFLGILLSTVLLLSLCACGSSVKGNTTYSGTVTALSLTSVTLKTENGEVTISLTEDTLFTADLSQGGDLNGDLQPDGGTDQLPGGDIILPDGEAGQLPEGDAGTPDGEMGQPPEGGMMAPGDMGGMMPGGDMGDPEGNPMSFSVYNLSLGDSITVETDKNGKAATVTMDIAGSKFWNIGQ